MSNQTTAGVRTRPNQSPPSSGLDEAQHPSMGSDVTIRPYRAADFDRQRRFFQEISQHARQMRFMSPCNEVSEQILSLLANVDHRTHLALVAEEDNDDGRTMIGEARFAADADDERTCEFAITLADHMRGRGLGRTLLKDLERRARNLGYTAMRAETLADNRAMIRLAQASGYSVVRHRAAPGLLLLEKDLTADNEIEASDMAPAAMAA